MLSRIIIRSLPLLVFAGTRISTVPLLAHEGGHRSIHDTVAAITERLRGQLSRSDLTNMTPYRIERELTEEERHILATEHIRFRVDAPVTVTLLRNRSFKSEPFWLRETFALTGLVLNLSGQEYDVWKKSYPAGSIGLGVNSLNGGGTHYVILVSAQTAGAPVNISELYPGQLRVQKFEPDMKPYVDRDEKLATLPVELADCWVVRTQHKSRDDAKLANLFRWTSHPSTPRPDQIVLTWSANPQTTQTIQWRTSPATSAGVVGYRKKAEVNRFYPEPLHEVAAETRVLNTPNVLNDPVSHRHTAVLQNLEPGTTYVYAVGNGTREGWTELAEFTTAPAGARPFSFIYMGDAQNGLDRWGSLVHTAFRERPDAAFYLMAGDLVDRGNERDDWDSFFFNAAGIYDRRPVVPVLGNHEYQGGEPKLYLDLFTLPENGPCEAGAERVYSFEYGNALFVVLDSNQKPEDQTAWLKDVLSKTKATWKFVAYHHPAYSSAPNRDNKDVREHWIPIFDKYHVDLALQGHDHAYLRTHPMKGGKKVDAPKDGTVYLVAVSGTKFYDQAARDYTEFGMTKVATYQVLDIQISGDRLVYRAYDVDGNLRDDFVIQK